MMLTFYKLFNDNKKNAKAQIVQTLFLKYCWTNWTFKWGKKKTIYWLHFLNLLPLKELQQIFVLYEAKVMIYWQKSEEIQKVYPISSIWMQTINIGSNSRFAKIYCCPISTYPTCVSRPPCFLIFRWLSSLFLQC